MSVPWNDILPLSDNDDTDDDDTATDRDALDDGRIGLYRGNIREQNVQMHEKVGPHSLLETCARFIGQNFPFELVQLHPQRVPEEVQKRIAYWSFPLEEKRLIEYAKMMGVSEHTISRVERVLDLKESDTECKKQRNVEFYDDYHEYTYNRSRQKTPIKDLLKITQIGMHLTGTVKELDQVYYHRGYQDTNSPISLCVQFDRGRITSTTCSCRSSSKWCEHVILLCIARIRGIVPCEIHPPVSEILSHFNRDQLQKLIQHFLEKVPLVGIPPVLEIACQLKDKESEVNKQLGAPDLTAGGCASEFPQWQIDENVVISSLSKDFQTLDDQTNAGIHNFKDFTIFLQNHDENVVTAFKWFLETIKRFHENPQKSRNLVYLVLMQGLQIFFVDPLISKGCKHEIRDLLKSQNACDLSEPLTEHYTGLLQEAVLVSTKNPKPTLHYLQKLQSALQGDITSTDLDFDAGLEDKNRILFSCLVAILRYRIFHKHSCNPGSSAVTSEVCKWVFPAMHSASTTFENLVTVNKCLEGIQVSSLLRHGQVLMEYLIHSGVDQQEILNFAAKLLGASSLRMSAIVQTEPKGTFFFVTQLEEAILCLAQQHISCERESFTPVLRQIVKEYLLRDVGEGVFIWPWSLLRLAALDPVMVEEVREVTQNYIGNANSILHCTSQTDQVYPPHVVDLVRNSLLSLLQHLFNSLQPDSAQVLFTTLSNAFPFPITYSAERSLPDELQDFSRSIVYEVQELQDIKEETEVGVLPNLQCDPWLLRLVQQNDRFISTNEAEQSILLKVASAKFSLNSKQAMFVEKLSTSPNIANPNLLFQLKVFYMRVYKCINGYHGRGYSYNHHTILNDDHNLQLVTPNGQKAFLYLVDNWQYCLYPSHVLDFIATKFKANSESDETAGFKEEVAQLISTVLLADKNAVKSMGYNQIESLVDTLARSDDPEHLLNFADTFDAKSDVKPLQHVGRAIGRLYSRMVKATEAVSHDTLSRLKTKCVEILEAILTCISTKCAHLMQFFSHPLFFSQHRCTNVLNNIAVSEWAPIVCASGEDAIMKFLTVLQKYHKVNSLRKFPYSFCQDLGILWTQYRSSHPSSSPSILGVPVFEKVTTHLLPEKEENARNAIKKYRNNAKKIKEAMLLLASIYQPLQLEKEFNSFAFEMSAGCSGDIKRMIVKRFINTPLSAIEIPTTMLQRLSQLDERGTARHQVDEQERDRPQEPDEQDHMMQQFRNLYAARLREEYARRQQAMFTGAFGGYYDDDVYDAFGGYHDDDVYDYY